jgi:hypothetical protein
MRCSAAGACLALDRERGSNAAIALGNLIDAELGAGDAGAAARSGRSLVATLLGTRNEYSLAFARINLLAALLARDEVAGGAPGRRSGVARRDGVRCAARRRAYLALLCALEGRPRAALRLAAYSEALYAARGETRELNETDATLRAQGAGAQRAR